MSKTVALTILASICALALIVFVSALDVDESTVALWKFDENNTNNITNDSTLNGNIGNVINAVWASDSISGLALEFNGVDSKAEITKTSSVDLTNNITLEAYVKRKSMDNGMIISKNGPYFLAIRNNVTMGGIYSNDGNCALSCTTPGLNTWTEVYGTTFLQQDIWYKIKLVYNGINIHIYVNDVLENATAKTGEMPQVSQKIHLGWGEPGHNQFFNGIIDEVRISNITRVTNKPTISLNSPKNYNVFTNTSLNLTFNVSTIIPLNYCTLNLGNVSVNSTSSYLASNLTLGTHNWNISCIDNEGNIGYSENRSFWIVADLSNVSEYSVSNSYGVINWTPNLNLSEELDWSQYIIISNNRVEINSSAASVLNKPARITLRSIGWSNPRILKDGTQCSSSECTEVSYNASSGEFIFDVTGFSVYQTDETPTPSSSSGSSSGGGGGGGGRGASVAKPKVVNSTLNNTVISAISNINDSSENIPNEIKTAGITGAIIGTNKGKSIIGAIVLLLVIVIGLIVVKRK